MNELIQKIEQWATDRNIIKGSKPIDQAMKLFSEFGELADNVGKGRDCRDDIGDIFVVLTVIAKQTGRSVADYVDGEVMLRHPHNKENVSELAYFLAPFVSYLTIPPRFNGQALVECIRLLRTIASNIGSSLEECVQIAHNDIKDRKGIMSNGVFIKESDPAYASIIASFAEALDMIHKQYIDQMYHNAGKQPPVPESLIPLSYADAKIQRGLNQLKQGAKNALYAVDKHLKEKPVSDVKKNKPQGATHYAEYEGNIIYFMNTKYGFRLLKDNMIQFDSSNIDHMVKPIE